MVATAMNITHAEATKIARVMHAQQSCTPTVYMHGMLPHAKL